MRSTLVGQQIIVELHICKVIVISTASGNFLDLSGDLPGASSRHLRLLVLRFARDLLAILRQVLIVKLLLLRLRLGWRRRRRHFGHLFHGLWPRIYRTLCLAKFHHILVYLVFLAQIIANVHEISQALNVIRIVYMDGPVNLEGQLVVARSAMTAGDHELPLHLLRLYLRGALEVGDSLLVHLVLDEVGTKPRNYIHVDWIITIRLLVIVEGLRLIFLFEVYVADAGEHRRVCRDTGIENFEPFDCRSRLVRRVEQVCDLPHHFDRIRYNCVQLLEEAEGSHVFAEPLVDNA
mmetsp:Transcript_14069/g.23336  ORF Transcript_14069/g.23336 Transcript_14069/m.23336 type:complete len:292 (+) Transcript_14069:159-1034(+)